MEVNGAHRHYEAESGAEATATPSDAMRCLPCDIRALAQREISRSLFERHWPQAHAAQWQERQSILLSHTEDYLDLACLLAYYGVDYNANIKRLTQPYDRFRQNPQVLSDRKDRESLCSLPARIGLVYRKQRDVHLLHLLLEMRLPTCHLRQAHREVLCGLWDQHRIVLLHTAGQSPRARRTLVLALIHMCSTVSDPTMWRACYRHLQDAIYVRERRLGWTARRIITLLNQAERRHERE